MRARAVERAAASNANQRARVVVARAALARSSSTRARGITRARLFACARALVRRAAARSAASSRVVGVESSRVVGVDVKFKSRRDARRRRDDERRSFTTRAHYRDGSRDARSLPVL